MKLDTASITVDNAATLLPAGIESIRAGDTAIDLAQVREVDSAAVALLVAWQREARAAGKSLSLAGVPEGVVSLATLYGVAALLGVAETPSP